MDLILTDRQGVWKGLRKLQKKQRKEVIEKRKKQKTKSAIGKSVFVAVCLRGLCF